MRMLLCCLVLAVEDTGLGWCAVCSCKGETRASWEVRARAPELPGRRPRPRVAVRVKNSHRGVHFLHFGFRGKPTPARSGGHDPVICSRRIRCWVQRAATTKPWPWQLFLDVEGPLEVRAPVWHMVYGESIRIPLSLVSLVWSRTLSRILYMVVVTKEAIPEPRIQTRRLGGSWDLVTTYNRAF